MPATDDLPDAVRSALDSFDRLSFTETVEFVEQIVRDLDEKAVLAMTLNAMTHREWMKLYSTVHRISNGA